MPRQKCRGISLCGPGLSIFQLLHRGIDSQEINQIDGILNVQTPEVKLYNAFAIDDDCPGRPRGSIGVHDAQICTPDGRAGVADGDIQPICRWEIFGCRDPPIGATIPPESSQCQPEKVTITHGSLPSQRP